MESETYADAVGRFLRDYRQRHGITLDAVAQLGREFGATWSLSSVQAIEGGRAAPTLPTLLTLALVLGQLSGEPLRLIDLLGAAKALDRPYVDRPDQPFLRPWVNRALSGDTVELKDGDYHRVWELPEIVWDEDIEREAYERMNRPITTEDRDAQVAQLWENMLEPPDPEEHRDSRRQSVSLAESRAAKKLRIQPIELQHRAHRLWGHSLEVETFIRAGRDSTPQARGRVTRLLVGELQKSLEKES